MNSAENIIEKHFLRDFASLKNKKVLLRVDWNLPVSENKILDLSRLNISIQLLKDLSFAFCKTIVVTHFGEKKEGLKIIAEEVTRRLPFIKFMDSLNLEEIKAAVSQMSDGDILLLENIRRFDGEVENLPSFSRDLSSLADVFINDAFSVSHREHASVVGVAKNMLSYFGPNFKREVDNLSEVINPKKPALFIIGGAKISSKLPLIKKYLESGTKVFVGGAMVHNIFKQREINIGKSLFDEKITLPEEFINHPLLITPKDVRLLSGEEKSLKEVGDTDVIVDCGKETVKELGEEMKRSNTVIYNGPLGLYEKGFLYGTEQTLTNLSNSLSKTYIGGGDTVTVAHNLGLLDKFSFVSLGGGAMLDYLSSGTLPGIEAVTK